MKYLLTICSNDKDPREGLLPARERYQSDFMQRVIEEGERTETPVLILSGKFGLLAPDTEIPDYDHLLVEDELTEMVPLVAGQLEDLEATEITAYIKKDRTVPHWGTYYDLIELGAHAAGVSLQYAERESLEPRSETVKLR